METITPTERRITCEVIGRPKLLATITPEGIWCYCRICKRAHLVSRAAVLAAWSGQEKQDEEDASFIIP